MRRTQPRGSPGVIMAGTRENMLKKAASVVSVSVRCSQPRPRPVIARGDAQQWRPRSAAETPSHPAAPAALWLRAPHKLHGHSLRRAVRRTPGACPPTSPRCARGADHTPQRAQHASRPAAPAAPLASCSPQAACGRSLRRAVRRTQGLVSQPLLCARGSDHTPQRAQPARTQQRQRHPHGFLLLASCMATACAVLCGAHMKLAPSLRARGGE